MIFNLAAIIIALLQLQAVRLFVRRHSPFEAFVHFFLCYEIVMLQLVPLVISTAKMEVLTGNAQVAGLFAYVFNFIYMTIALVAWASLRHRFRAPPREISNRFAYVVLAVSAAFNIASLLSFISPFLRAEFDPHSMRAVQSGLEAAMFPFYAFIANVSKVAPFLVLMFCENKGRMRLIAALACIIYFISILPSGHRGSLVLPILFFVFYHPAFTSKKRIVLLVAFACIFIPLSDYFKSMRVLANPLAAASEQEYFSRGFLDEVDFRLGEYNKISRGISEMISDGKTGGITPLSSAALAVIPASLQGGEKPWPGSVDGTEFGILARLAHEHVYGAGWNMSEFMYSLHPIWELGFTYFFLNALLAGVLLASVEFVAGWVGDSMRLLPIVALLPFTYNLPFAPLVMWLQSFAYVILPGILLFLMLNVLTATIKLRLWNSKLVQRSTLVEPANV